MGGILILLYLPDRKDLFLRAVAAIGKCSLSVVDARVHTTRHGWALDTFLVTDRYEREDEEALSRKITREMMKPSRATALFRPPRRASSPDAPATSRPARS